MSTEDLPDDEFAKAFQAEAGTLPIIVKPTPEERAKLDAETFAKTSRERNEKLILEGKLEPQGVNRATGRTYQEVRKAVLAAWSGTKVFYVVHSSQEATAVWEMIGTNWNAWLPMEAWTLDKMIRLRRRLIVSTKRPHQQQATLVFVDHYVLEREVEEAAHQAAKTLTLPDDTVAALGYAAAAAKAREWYAMPMEFKREYLCEPHIQEDEPAWIKPHARTQNYGIDYSRALSDFPKFEVKTDESVPEGEVHIRDSRTSNLMGKIENISKK
jgi:hypothetical protein